MTDTEGQPEAIHPRMTVREVLTRYPWLEEVFDRHGLQGCGGPNGPVEPIGMFALVHRMDPAALVADLNRRLAAHSSRAAGPISNDTPTAAAPPPARLGAPIYRRFIAASLVIALTMGFTTGAALLLAPLLGVPAGIWWLTHAQGHGVAQLFGFAGLFTAGVAYHTVPRFRNVSLALRPLATPSLALIGGGVVGRAFTQGLSGAPWGGALLVTSGAALLLGVTLFAVIVAATLRRGQRRHEAFEPWLLSGVAWAVVAAALHLALVTRMAVGRFLVAPAALDTAFVHAALFGFLLNVIFGISLRVIPAFMRLRAPHTRLAHTALVLFNLGIAWQVAAWLLQPSAPWWVAGAIVQAAGMVVAWAALGVLQRRSAAPVYGPGTYRHYEWYVRAAHAWFLVAAALWLYLALDALAGHPFTVQVPTSGARHVVTLGVVTMMILGMGTRILPIFEGARLQMPLLMDAAFVLLNLSVGLRLAFSIVMTDASAALVGVSGVAGLLAVGLFTLVVWRTLRPAAREDYRQAVHVYVGNRLASRQPAVAQARIEPQAIVADVLERWPQTLSVFLRHGFTPLGDERMRGTVARATTVEAACRLMGVDLEPLLAELSRAARQQAGAGEGLGDHRQGRM